MSSTWVRASVLAALSIASVHAHAMCTFGTSAEPSLQSSIDTLLGPNQLSAANDCVADGADAQWTTTKGGATIVLELAGNAGSNVFGLYDLSNPNNRAEIFQGVDGAGDSASIRIVGSGNNHAVEIKEDGATRTMNIGAATSFGLYLLGANGALYSESARNGGSDFMYAYKGTNGTFIDGPFTVDGTVFASSDYLLAWEDLRAADNDYQDFMVLMRSVTPATVPLPPAAWLLVSGLIGLVGVSRRTAR